MKTIAILLSGGTGERLGEDIPKQYIPISHKRIITYSMQTLLAHKKIEGILVVASQEWREILQREWVEYAVFHEKFMGFVDPGQTRQLSVWNALQWISSRIKKRGETEEKSAVLVHDAARPFLTEDQISAIIQAMEGHDGVMPGLPMKDTVYLSRDGLAVSDLLERKQMFAGQAPEIFDFKKYYKANESLFPERIKQINGSTEPAILGGMDIVMIPGDEQNFKITTQADLQLARERMSRIGK